MTRFLGIVGSKGGIGKTTLTLNLANVLSKMKKSVVAIDGDLNGPDFATYFNQNDKHIHHVMKKEDEILDTINQTESGLHYITSSHKLDHLHAPENLEFNNSISRLMHKYEYVIVDTGSNLSKESMIAAQSCDDLILVTEPNMLSIKEALRTKTAFEHLGKNFSGLIVNKSTGSKFELPHDDIRSILGLPILGAVSEDKLIKDCMHNNILSTDYSLHNTSSKEIMSIAKKIARH